MLYFHRSCEGVVDVENVACEENSIRDVQKMQDESKLIYDKLVACKIKKEKELEETEEKYTVMSKTIGKTKQKLIHHVETLAMDAARELQIVKADIRKNVEADKSCIAKMIESLGERNCKLEKACQIGDQQRFIQVKLSKMATSNAREFIEQIDSKATKVLNMTENVNMKDAIISGEKLFTICTLEK